MWQSEEGIVLSKVKYMDNQFILKLYLRDSGYKSFLLRGARTKKKNLLPVLQPLSILNCQVNIRDNKGIHGIKEISPSSDHQDFNNDLGKNSILLFLCEVLHKTLEEDYENEDLYDFIVNSIKYLHQCEIYVNFHLFFMLELSNLFGFYPTHNYSETKNLFDMRLGSFIDSDEYHDKMILNKTISHHLHNLLGMIFDEFMSYKMTSKERFQLLCELINYFSIHVEGMRSIKSHEIFKEVFE